MSVSYQPADFTTTNTIIEEVDFTDSADRQLDNVAVGRQTSLHRDLEDNHHGDSRDQQTELIARVSVS
jgi:hypothetical protein